MERPNHLKIEQKSAANKATSLAIVIAIHVAGIFGLVAALSSGALMKQLQEIKATVDTQKVPPKAPPPPPPDLVKPPPPVAIVPEFTVASAPPPPVTTVAKAPPAPPPPPRVSDTVLRPIARSRTKPAYPPISVRLGESGTTLMEVKINTEGSVTECKVVKSSSSERLDTAACDHVLRNYRWQPPTSQGQPVAATVRINMVWDLKDANK